MPTSPPPSPLIQQLAVLTRLAEDNHQLIRRLTHDLEHVTHRNALLIQQLRIALEFAAR